MKIILLLTFITALSLCGYSQCSSILIEHKTGGGDGGHMNFWIVDNAGADTTLYDKFVEKHNDGRVLGCTFFSTSQPKSFAIVEKLLSKFNSKEDYKDRLEWGCLEISKYDSNDRLVYRHYICCGEHTLEKIKKLSKKRAVKKYIEINGLFDLILFSLEETKPKNATTK